MILENIRKRDRKLVKILSIVTLLSFICCITLVIITAQKPESPEFCARCHSMESSYKSWKETVSCNTGCLGCHTHDKSGRTLSVEMEDSNCTNTECHPVDKITSKVSNYKDRFLFNHQTHLKEYPTNLKLRCTGCHSYLGRIEQKDGEIRHFGIEENTCFVCHFFRGPAPLLTAENRTEVDDCTLCHKEVGGVIHIYDKVFEHKRFENTLKVKCTNCHFDTVQGDGGIEERNCYRCHTKIPQEYKGAERMHTDHVEKHKVPCSSCHNEIRHKWGEEYIVNILPERKDASGEKTSPPFSIASSTKGSGVISISMKKQKNQESFFGKVPYVIQRKLYAGKGGMGIGGSPDPMYLATVNCIACHKDKDKGVNPMACNVCHEKGFNKTMVEQREFIKSRLRLLSELLDSSTDKPVPGALIDQARYNYQFIIKDGSYGVHNIKYVKDLLDYSIQQLQLFTRMETGNEPTVSVR